MLNRRAFIQVTALGLPLAGCTSRNAAPPEARVPLGNLTPEQLDAAQRDTLQFESVLETIRKADVPYAVEPRFFPSV